MGLLFTDTFPSIVAATKCSECAPARKIVRKRWELWGADHHCIVGLPSTARESCERNPVVNTFLCAKKSDRRRNMFSACLYSWLFSLKVATGVIYFHSRYIKSVWQNSTTRALLSTDFRTFCNSLPTLVLILCLRYSVVTKNYWWLSSTFLNCWDFRPVRGTGSQGVLRYDRFLDWEYVWCPLNSCNNIWFTYIDKLDFSINQFGKFCSRALCSHK